MDNQHKRLLFQSWHRGTKELDLLLGPFFKENGADFNEGTLALYEKFLTEDDYSLYQWLTIDASTPPIQYKDLIHDIQKFHQFSS